MLWQLACTACFLSVLLWLRWRRSQMEFFKRLGIPGPEPSIFFGNMLEYRQKGPTECHKQWIQAHGKVLGFFFGSRPVLLVSDLDLLKKIQIKEAHKFINRPGLFTVGAGKRHSPLNQHLTALKGQRWKEVRSTLTPAFTGLKIRKMFPVVSECVSSLMSRLEERRLASEGGVLDVCPLFQELTMKVIGQSALGIKDASTDKVLFNTVRMIFAAEMRSLIFVVGFSFREFHFFLGYIMVLLIRLVNKGHFPYVELGDACRAVVKERRDNPERRRPDLLQGMIDAERVEGSEITDQQLTQEDSGEVNEGRKADPEANPRPALLGKKMVGLTDDEVVSNAILVLLAGYETTSSALSFAIQLLTEHPDVQDRLREELDNLLDNNQEEIDYSSLQKLTYMDQVFNECLRIRPPIYHFVIRESVEETQLGRWTFPAEMAIMVPVYNLHHDPELWPDPETFDPERFSPERRSSVHPCALQSFGLGPRNCIGMRFAQMEAKLALAKLLRKYTFLPTTASDGRNKEPVPDKDLFTYSAVSIAPKNGVKVIVAPRTKPSKDVGV